MHAPVGHESQKMHAFVVLARVVKSFHEHFFSRERSVFRGQIYFCQVLINDASGAQIHVSNFGISHLSVRKPNVKTVRTQPGMGILEVKAVDKRCICLCDG